MLVADDDPIIRMDVRQALESLGFEVVAEAGDGQQAVALAREARPDVCVLDVKMPAMDGIEAATLLADEGVAPSVLLTAYGDRELVDRAREAGVFGYLVKPYKPNDLPPAIEVAVGRFRQLQALQDEVRELNEKLETRKLLDRAKGILMAERGMAEPEAYRSIQMQAMSSRHSIKEVAEAIILASSIGSGEGR